MNDNCRFAEQYIFSLLGFWAVEYKNSDKQYLHCVNSDNTSHKRRDNKFVFGYHILCSASTILSLLGSNDDFPDFSALFYKKELGVSFSTPPHTNKAAKSWRISARILSPWRLQKGSADALVICSQVSIYSQP